MRTSARLLFGLAALGLFALALACHGSAGRKQASDPEHFGTALHYPKFHSFGEFFRGLKAFTGIMAGRFQGQKVDLSWMTPAFREKIWLTVTLANHCVV